MIYKLYKAFPSDVVNAVMTINSDPCKSFLFDPNNGDYKAFKAQINSDEAQLQDAYGNVMTQADAFIATLP
jgi:hypothetical protein